jgi:pSer/pThr/pTyr-binding forkhead associated (FHA) protein
LADLQKKAQDIENARKESAASAPPPVRPAERKQSNAEMTAVDIPKECGWIIVHDEHTQSQTFSLQIGQNIIGRKSESKPCHIMIDTTDSYMSRNHCVLEVKQKGHRYEYLISDIGSTNGTFINADKSKRLKKGDVIFLKDGDVIQIGRTKVVLKTPDFAHDAHSAYTQVSNSDFSATIIV